MTAKLQTDLTPEERTALLKAYPGIKLSDIDGQPTTLSTPTRDVVYLPPAQEKQVKRRRPAKSLHWPTRSLWVYPAILAIGVLGSAFLGLGWVVTEIGQGIWHIGKHLHEDKWRIGE